MKNNQAVQSTERVSSQLKYILSLETLGVSHTTRNETKQTDDPQKEITYLNLKVKQAKETRTKEKIRGPPR